MARKSSIDKLSKEVRSHIERALRENKLTLDELIADLQQTFPGADKPSRSSLGRYRQSFDEMVAKMRQQETMARLLVEELGENPDERAGALLTQSVTTLVNAATWAAQEKNELNIDDVLKLAKAAREVTQSRKLSRDERREIAKDARDALLKEQQTRLEEARGTDGMSEQLESRIRGILLGKA